MYLHAFCEFSRVKPPTFHAWNHAVSSSRQRWKIRPGVVQPKHWKQNGRSRCRFSDAWVTGKTWSETREIWRWPFSENHWVQWKNDKPPAFQNLTPFSFCLSPWCHGRIELGMSLQILLAAQIFDTWSSAPRNWLRSPCFEPSGGEI